MITLGPTYSRSELVRVTGSDPNRIDYLIRLGALRPKAGGGGKGQHRKFDRLTLTIAKVLAELDWIGSDTGLIVELGNRFHDAVDFMELTGIALVDDFAASLAEWRHEIDQKGYALYPDSALFESAHLPAGFGDAPLHKRDMRHRELTWEQIVLLERQAADRAGVDLTDEIVRRCATISPEELQHLRRFGALHHARSIAGRLKFLVLYRNSDGLWVDEFRDDANPPEGVKAVIGIDVSKLKIELWGRV